MNDTVYELYKLGKQIMEKSKIVIEEWKIVIAHFDASDKGYAERYEQEKKSNE
jgi:hypothetical protein